MLDRLIQDTQRHTEASTSFFCFLPFRSLGSAPSAAFFVDALAGLAGWPVIWNKKKITLRQLFVESIFWQRIFFLLHSSYHATLCQMLGSNLW